MSKSSYTPGPWARNINYKFPIYTESDHKKVAYCLAGKYDQPSEEEANANLRLIAAAPDMAEALKMVDDFEAYVIEERDPEIKVRNEAWIANARAALAKAGIE